MGGKRDRALVVCALTLRMDPMVSGATRLELEREAEILAAYQLDLLAQVEVQVRAVHGLMRCLEQLRVRKPGQTTVELANGQRADTIGELSTEMAGIERQLRLQQQCCAEMQATIARMEHRLPVLKTAVVRLSNTEHG